MIPRAARTVLKMLGGAAIAAVLPIAGLRWFEHQQTYHPIRSLSAEPSQLGRPWEQAQITTNDGVQLHGWFFPANPDSPRKHLAVLVCHGNAGNISHRLGLYDALLATGINVLAFDYRGFGLSAGTPGENGTYLDARAAHTWLQARAFAPEHILVYGESLGGGIASELALSSPCGALILDKTFTSLPDIGSELFPFLPVHTLGSIRYNTRARLPQIRIPVLILHSRADSLIPFHHAEDNFAAANQPKWLQESSGDHNDGILDRTRFLASIELVLNQLAPH